MKVLIGCEYSGIVRDAFIALGHDAMSCDLLPTESSGPHYEGSILDVIDFPWDLAIFHPPCTHLSVSGARHFPKKKNNGKQQSAVSFFMTLAKADIPKIAMENPICRMSKLYNRGCLDTVKPKQPVCGLKICPNLSQQTLLTAGKTEYTGCPHQKTGAKKEAKHTKE
jgi:hypothetical protein